MLINSKIQQVVTYKTSNGDILKGLLLDDKIQCSASVNEHDTVVLFKLNNTLIYTFSMDVTR